MARLAVMGRQARSPGQTGSAGFTLTEVMIAIVVLSLVSLGGAASVVGVINGNAVSKRVAVAAMLTQTKIEDLKNLPYTDGDLTAGTHPPSAEPLTVEGGGSYTRTWTVTAVAGVVMKTITVTVQWKTGGTTHQVAMTTSRGE